jgi:putative flippase GtrA
LRRNLRIHVQSSRGALTIVNEIYAQTHGIAPIFAAFMRRLHYTIRRTIFAALDIFYPLFRKLMPLQTYHYAACGGSNTLLSLFIYFFSYNFILNKHILHLGFIAFKPHIAALFIAFIITFPIGFYLSMFVVFQGSDLKRRVQLFRYFLVVLGSMTINYICLKIFVEVFGWYPTPSQLLTTVIVICFSYFSQRHFSFKVVGAAPGRKKVRV